MGARLNLPMKAAMTNAERLIRTVASFSTTAGLLAGDGCPAQSPHEGRDDKRRATDKDHSLVFNDSRTVGWRWVPRPMEVGHREGPRRRHFYPCGLRLGASFLLIGDNNLDMKRSKPQQHMIRKVAPWPPTPKSTAIVCPAHTHCDRSNRRWSAFNSCLRASFAPTNLGRSDELQAAGMLLHISQQIASQHARTLALHHQQDSTSCEDSTHSLPLRDEDPAVCVHQDLQTRVAQHVSIPPAQRKHPPIAAMARQRTM
ncbi:hypothetical protein PtA15_18A404 [Puccinia triticina]|uniref:Uncharacterized protein n=1 Tax=Puccinia triticina TaxID=208348 RepID=A0ABY7D6Q6_9BASI|nr:uncharacterized protein PtA15_18A404 [Puccinia triticina]WAQ93344.1 hypothetical protein PtA15_18A404 [Puccinia triticina]WAR63344.1 hypothetical protein PtB15_18B427 [Puccinia triticina]